jgi:hypothetical protein
MSESEHNQFSVLQAYLLQSGIKKTPQQFLKELPQEARDKLLALLDQKAKLREGKALSRWSFTQNYHRTHKLEPLSWYRRDYLRQLYADEAKEIVIRKAVQVGISEWAVVDILYMTMELGWSGAYILTKTKTRDGFVAERVNKVLNAVKYYKDHVGSIDNLGIKELGKGMIRFLGSNAADDFVSFPADFVIIDEVDLCDQKNLALVPDRLQASEHKYQRWIGNPTTEDFGIDKLYKESDQKVWEVWCTKCKRFYNLDWFLNVVNETEFGVTLRDTTYTGSTSQIIWPICIECGTKIDRYGRGQWSKQNLISKRSGYTLSQIYSSTVTLEEMWTEYLEIKDNLSKLQLFYNNRLGLPFNRSGFKITEGMLSLCQQQYPFQFDYAGSNTVVAGVDVGGTLHVVVRELLENGERRLLFVGALADFSSLTEIINRYSVSVMCIDAEPEQRKAREFQQDHSDIVWLCDYHVQDSNTQNVVVNKDRQFMRAKRTPALDSLLEEVLTQKFVLPYNSKEIYQGDYFKHLTSSTRIQEDERFIWTNKGADHWLHAESYCKLAHNVITGVDVHFSNMGTEDFRTKSTEEIVDILLKSQQQMLLNFFYE